MKKEDSKIKPQDLLIKINEYLEKINNNDELKQNFEDFDKYYLQFIQNKGVDDILQRKKLSGTGNIS